MVLGENMGTRHERKVRDRLVASEGEIRRDAAPLPISAKGGRSKFVRRDADLEVSMSSVGLQTSQERCNSILKQLEQDGDEKMLKFFELMRINGKLAQNPTAYTTALRAWVRKGDWLTLTCAVFNSLILECSKRGIVNIGAKLSQMMLDKGIRPDKATFAMLMTLYQKGGNLSEAELTFNQMRSSKTKCVTGYSAMITIYTRTGLYDKSEGIINLMEEDGIPPNLENWLVRINAYSQQGKLEEAESVLKSMRDAGFSPNIVAYNTLITGYGKVSDSDAARHLFQGLQSLGLKPDATTYRSMIEGCGREGNYKEARRFYLKLKTAGFRPSSSNFYTMINLQARHGDDDGAVQILKDMRLLGCQYPSILGILLQAYERVGGVSRDILADQTSCSILVLAYVQASLLDDALAILRKRKWKDSAYEDNLYHLLICSCKEAGSYENADIIFKQMLELGRDPNLHITSSMIDIYGSMGRFQAAKDLHLRLEASGVPLDMVAYSILVRMYVKAGSLEDACAVLESMERRKDIIPDTFLYRDMLRIYQRCGMREKLADVYYRMLRSGLAWDEAMYNCVINCCARALPVDEISKLFDEMIGHGYAANTITFNVMMDVYCKAGLLVKARKLFSMAKKQGLADVISYNIIIAAYGQARDFRRMEYIAYNSMLDAYGKEDQVEEFKCVLKKMKELRCDSDHYTYNTLINIYGRKPDLYSYNTLIKVYGIAGMVEEAVDVVREMRAQGVQPDRVTYSTLICALQRNEEFLEAVKWSLWMKQIELGS
ncbi:unnamed protein product [Spirodela intermedia]|uniref:Uncharacterized protein n=1 Tax=Spirodela intermedia TaxID=51605 RepID=A0A7I8JLH7_SPIIN|nr:unnamed protein product [Spirodela intermedia]CAA6671009.1 unnamed protein product [Spirodela intermedia]